MQWKKWFKVISILIAIHSFFVGVFLMFLPADLITFFGFPLLDGNFFRAQGGIFHVVMVIAYLLPVIDFDKHWRTLYFSVSAKLIATIFLTTYFFVGQPIMTILLSGILDFIMCVILFLFLQKQIKNELI